MRVNGTPADCVLGASLGTGRCGALGAEHGPQSRQLHRPFGHRGRSQAALLGLRGVALSAPAGVEPDFEPFKPWIRRVLQRVLGDVTLPLMNVNFPRDRVA